MSSVYYEYNSMGSGSSSGGSQASKIVNLASGQASQNFTYTNPVANTAVLVIGQPFNTVDSSPIFLQAVVTAFSTTGFTVLFNVAPDTANYQLSYVVVPAI